MFKGSSGNSSRNKEDVDLFIDYFCDIHRVLPTLCESELNSKEQGYYYSFVFKCSNVGIKVHYH